MSVKGFRFAGIRAGIRRSGYDLGLIVSDELCSIAGVTTTNSLCAAPVLHTREVIKRGIAKALIVNSGNANAFTGQKGVDDCAVTARYLAHRYSVDEFQIAVASTGIIGIPLPVDIILESIPRLVDSLEDVPERFAEAIMTTDKKLKVVKKEIEFIDGVVNLVGVAKGSGMIKPNMATMLGFICTDIAMTPETLQSKLNRIVKDTFNMISVDTDTSTNDMVTFMANGASGVDFDKLAPHEQLKLYTALFDICRELAIMIARDGEGATKLLQVTVKEASTREDARKIVHAVIGSPLVKAALYAGDPNWGRIVMAVGKAGVPNINQPDLTIKFGDMTLVDKGEVKSISRERLGDYLNKIEVAIEISVSQGVESVTGWGCDLTEEYVTINSCYN